MYYNLPSDYASAQPVLQRAMRETAGSVLPLVSTTKQPDPPRSLIAQPGTGLAVVTWNAPAKANDVAGYRVYRDNEKNFYAAISDPASRQIEVTMAANSSTYVYVSCVNSSGRESIKVGVKASSDGNQYVASSGVNGNVPGLPPGYPNEPSGGNYEQYYRQYEY